jgi:hypothetical protein
MMERKWVLLYCLLAIATACVPFPAAAPKDAGSTTKRVQSKHQPMFRLTASVAKDKLPLSESELLLD